MTDDALLNSVPPDIDRLLTSGLTELQLGRLFSADLHLSAALAAAEYRDSTAALLSALQLLGHLALRRDHPQQAALLYGRALALSQRLNYLLGTASALHNLGIAAASIADPDSALFLIARAHQIYRTLEAADARDITRRNLLLLAVVTTAA